MDKIDCSILKILRENARVSLKTISENVHLSIPAVRERLYKMERHGVLKKYTIQTNPEAFGKSFSCYCLVSLSSHSKKNDVAFQDYAKASNDILECHRVTGGYEYLLKIVTDSAHSMEKIIDKMKTSLNVVNTSTFLILTTAKEDSSALPQLAPPAAP